MKSLSFPVWLAKNEDRCKDDGSECLLLRGGPPSPLPASLPVFSTEQIAKNVLHPSWPFKLTEVDSAAFYDALRTHPEIEDVILDMGTKNATKFMVKDLLTSS